MGIAVYMISDIDMITDIDNLRKANSLKGSFKCFICFSCLPSVYVGKL